MKPTEQIQVQLDWLELHGVDRFDLAVQRSSGVWMSQSPSLTRQRLEQCLPWCRAENTRGANVYVRPSGRSPWPVIFLDDVALIDAVALAEAHPSLVVETSPDRCHVWINTDRALDERSRFAVQKRLAAGSATDGRLADAGSVSGDHWGRLAGFRNRKPTRDCWVNVRRASRRLSPLPVGPLLDGASAHFSPRSGGSVEQGRAASPGRPGRASSESEREWAMVMHRLEHGEPPAAVEAWLVEQARPRRGSDAERYAHATVVKAFSTVRRRCRRE